MRSHNGELDYMRDAVRATYKQNKQRGMKDIQGYKLYIKEVQEQFDKLYPDLRLEGKPYNQYVFNFLERAIQDALENNL